MKTNEQSAKRVDYSILALLYLISLVLVQIRKIGHVPAVLISLFALAYLFLKAKGARIDKNTFLPVVLLIAAAFISLIANFNKTSLTYFIGIVVNVFLYNNLINRIAKRYLKVFFAVLFLMSIVPFNDANKLASIFGNSITLGLALNVLIYLLFLLWKDIKIRLPFLIILLGLIYLTGSRSALLYAFVFFLLYGVYSWKGKKYFLLASVAIIGFTFLAYYFLSINENYRHIIMKYHQRNIFDLSGRDSLFRISMKGIMEYPFGIGLGRSGDYLQKFTTGSSPHNALLKMALEGGWLFLASYLILICSAVRHARLKVTACALVAYNLKSVFEIATPFGYSFVSAFLILPYFLERAFPEDRQGSP